MEISSESLLRRYTTPRWGQWFILDASTPISTKDFHNSYVTTLQFVDLGKLEYVPRPRIKPLFTYPADSSS